MGFKLFAIEANMPEAYRVNEYVLTGKGDPKELLRGMYFWTWDTQEVLDMILWMRQFNQSGKGRIEFLGFDMQFGQVAMANVREFVAKADPDYARDLENAYKGSGDYSGTRERASAARACRLRRRSRGQKRAWEVVKHLEASRAEYLKKAAADEVDRAIQDARIAAQAAQTKSCAGGGLYRDQCMAENVAWILDHAPPGSRIVLWAHNGHVGKQLGLYGKLPGEAVWPGHGGLRLCLPRRPLHGRPARARAGRRQRVAAAGSREAWSRTCTRRGCRAWSSTCARRRGMPPSRRGPAARTTCARSARWPWIDSSSRSSSPMCTTRLFISIRPRHRPVSVS